MLISFCCREILLLFSKRVGCFEQKNFLLARNDDELMVFAKENNNQQNLYRKLS
jgi:hypothetical protein